LYSEWLIALLVMDGMTVDDRRRKCSLCGLNAAQESKGGFIDELEVSIYIPFTGRVSSASVRVYSLSGDSKI
jgi:hypothetical protein